MHRTVQYVMYLTENSHLTILCDADPKDGTRKEIKKIKKKIRTPTLPYFALAIVNKRI